MLNGIRNNGINWLMVSNLSRFTSLKRPFIPSIGLSSLAYCYYSVNGISYGLARCDPNNWHPLYSELFLGYARERIEGARLESFETGISGSVWNRVLSQCQFISFTKNIFFNNVVLKKGNYVKSAKYFW
jgi:hypothetical protein